MPQIIADRRDVDFVLHEQFRVSELSLHDRYADFSKTVIDMVITEARNLAVKEILPTLKIGDEIGCRFENGTVDVPDEFKAAWNLLREGGWFAPAEAPEWGGQGLPHSVNVMAQNYLMGANLPLLMVAGLNHGAGKIIETFGTDRQKDLYLEKLYTGEWSGTMLLTEPEAGSNLSDLTTSAIPCDDGSYLLTGNKIFISGGDHDMTDNIVHLVLARIQGAPEGSRGISLFVAPKFIPDDAGGPWVRNDIVCTGIEEKMGMHGSPTCSMALGGSGRCVATLVGKENHGLPIMFLMMNKARLMVGSQGLACASSAFLHALDWARSRVQGTLPGSTDRKQVLIISHPDVRRMLLTMKMYTEGMRSLLCYIGVLEDRKQIAVNDTDRKHSQDLIDFLTPIAKAYVTDRAVDICNLAIQVFGGYGYTCEFPVEQLARDVRITTIYEGTNAIQSMDLVFRKLSGGDNRRLLHLISEITNTVATAKQEESLAPLAAAVESILVHLEKTARALGNYVTQGRHLDVHTFACLFLEATGDVIMAWMLLWRAVLAVQGLRNKAGKKQGDFYHGQVRSAEFFIQAVLPVTSGKLSAVINLSSAATAISDSSFGGK